MTTGMKPGRTEASVRQRRANWIWFAVGVVIVVALIAIAVNSSRRNTLPRENATLGSEQSSGTGQQGSVGNFSGTVIPNTNPSTNAKSTSRTDVTTPAPANSGTSDLNGAGGADAGAGNSGITTATDSNGGSTTLPNQTGKGAGSNPNASPLEEPTRGR